MRTSSSSSSSSFCLVPPALVISCLLSACGGGGGGASDSASSTTTTAAATQDVQVTFVATVGSTPVSCASTLSGLGSQASSAQLRDLRFYLSNVRLVSSSGAEVAVTLTPNDWQTGSGTEGAVLIDLADTASGVCAQASDGSAAVNATIVGKVPPGTYTGLRATVGLSDALNHSDVMTAAAPLDNMAMGWSWQNGRKFIKLEIDPSGGVADGSTTATTYAVHIASTNCSGGNVATATCVNANMPRIDIAFNPASQRVALDLNELFRGVDVATNATGAVGCMSASTDTDCTTLFTNLGLRLSDGGNVGTQQVFRAIAQ